MMSHDYALGFPCFHQQLFAYLLRHVESKLLQFLVIGSYSAYRSGIFE